MTLDSVLATSTGADLGTGPADDAAPLLTVKNLRKQFTRVNGTQVRAVDDISLEVRPGEFVVLLGPSGCGKTTLLRCIGGLETAGGGSIELGGHTVFDPARRVNVPSRRRGVSMVFQSYALWPNMTVFDNVAYPLRSKGRASRMARKDIKEAVEDICKVVGISEVLHQYPHHISGGQQQRVALARALVVGASLVLFDEPLSNVDAKVRKELRIELAALQARFGFAAVYVTHDQEDAMELADRIVILDGGKIAQVGPPAEIYDQPATPYVASFVGSSNLTRGTVVSADSAGLLVETSFGQVRTRLLADAVAGQAVDVMFRPQHGVVHLARPEGPNVWLMRSRKRMHSGTHATVILRHDAQRFQVRADVDQEIPEDVDVWLAVEPRHVHAFARES